jgi:hypothetical protein
VPEYIKEIFVIRSAIKITLEKHFLKSEKVSSKTLLIVSLSNYFSNYLKFFRANPNSSNGEELEK